MNNSILKQLYDGEIAPMENLKITNPNYKEVSHKLSDMKENFIKSLSETDSQTFDEIEILSNECSSIYDYENFAQGLRIGAELMLEMLNYKQS